MIAFEILIRSVLRLIKAGFHQIMSQKKTPQHAPYIEYFCAFMNQLFWKEQERVESIVKEMKGYFGFKEAENLFNEFPLWKIILSDCLFGKSHSNLLTPKLDHPTPLCCPLLSISSHQRWCGRSRKITSPPYDQPNFIFSSLQTWNDSISEFSLGIGTNCSGPVVLPLMTDRIASNLGIQFSLTFIEFLHSLNVTFIENALKHKIPLLSPQHVISMNPRTKQMNLLDHAQGYILKATNSQKTNKRVTRLQDLSALNCFENALESSPLNKITLRNLARLYFRYWKLVLVDGVLTEHHEKYLGYLWEMAERSDPNDTHTLFQYSAYLWTLGNEIREKLKKTMDREKEDQMGSKADALEEKAMGLMKRFALTCASPRGCFLAPSPS